MLGFLCFPPAYSMLNKSFLAVAEAAFGWPLAGPPCHSRAPCWTTVFLHDLGHMQVFSKQLDPVTDEVPVPEPNCPPASPVSRCTEAALADFISITTPFAIARSSLSHVPVRCPGSDWVASGHCLHVSSGKWVRVVHPVLCQNSVVILGIRELLYYWKNNLPECKEVVLLFKSDTVETWCPGWIPDCLIMLWWLKSTFIKLNCVQHFVAL